MSVFYDLSKTPRNILNQAIVRAIVSANNGLLFDPSDMTTMFQDAAGTIPVTAVEQPVGKILDKSGNGNHATQSVTASRPVLSARKNVLLATEALSTQSVTSIAAQYTLSFTGTGSITLSGTATGTLTGTGVNDRVSLRVTPTAGTLTLTVSGSVTKAQLELGASAGQYQRVNTATDYDTDERYFPKYLRFDGVDDYLNLPYMGLYAGGSASVVVVMSSFTAGGASDIIAERNKTDAAPVYVLLGKASASILTGVYIRNNSNYIVLNSISTAVGDITSPATIKTITDNGSVVKKHVNAILADADTYARSGTLTLNSTTIAASNSTKPTGFLLGNLYSLIITKSALSDAQRIACERYTGRKAGVKL